jgi:hypothetical protein
VPPRGFLAIHYHIRKEKARGIIPAQQEQMAEFDLAFSDGDLQVSILPRDEHIADPNTPAIAGAWCLIDHRL